MIIGKFSFRRIPNSSNSQILSSWIITIINLLVFWINLSRIILQTMLLYYANIFSFYLLPLQKMAKWSSQHNGKYPDPYSKLKFNDEKKKEKKKKKNKNRDREHNRENKILSQIDSNANKVRCIYFYNRQLIIVCWFLNNFLYITYFFTWFVINKI